MRTSLYGQGGRAEGQRLRMLQMKKRTAHPSARTPCCWSSRANVVCFCIRDFVTSTSIPGRRRRSVRSARLPQQNARLVVDTATTEATWGRSDPPLQLLLVLSLGLSETPAKTIVWPIIPQPRSCLSSNPAIAQHKAAVGHHPSIYHQRLHDWTIASCISSCNKISLDPRETPQRIPATMDTAFKTWGMFYHRPIHPPPPIVTALFPGKRS